MTKIYVWCTACDKRVESIYMLFKGNHIINRLECGHISKTTFESAWCGIPSDLKTENMTDNYISSILHKRTIKEMSDDKDLSKEQVEQEYLKTYVEQRDKYRKEELFID